jgi:outer membrane protein assembly factor BamB
MIARFQYCVKPTDRNEIVVLRLKALRSGGESMERMLVVLLSCCFVAGSLGADRLVPSQYAKIQEAIDAAQDGDVVIVQPGIYHESLRFRGKAITVRASDLSSWQAVGKTVIAGWKTRTSCVVFDQGETNASVLEGFQLYKAYGGSPIRLETGLFGDAGGGVLCVNSSPTIKGCWIEGNYAYYGGGIAMFGECRARIVNCLITHNSAQYVGGAIFIRREVAKPAGSPPPGRRQSAAGATSSLTDESPVGSFGWEDGPAIINCTIANNVTGGYGKGDPDRYDVDCWDAKPLLLNTIIYGAQPSLLIWDLSAISHCCIKETHLFQGDYKGSVGIADIASTANSFGGFPGFVKVPDEPVDIEDYGSEYHLDVTSPCVNAGSPVGLEYVQHDIDGQGRLMGAQIDIGADEVQPMLVVMSPWYNDVWASGSLRNIRWNSYLYEGTVDVHFSANGGGNWLIIASDLPNTGCYAWDLPSDVDSNTCIVALSPHEREPTVLRIDCDRFAIHPDLTRPGVDSAWPSLGGKFARSGLSESQGPDAGCVKWRFETGAAVVASVTAGFDRRVHIACEDGKLHTLDANGRPLWTCTTDSAALSSPTVGPDGSLFVGTEDGTLYAIDVTGKSRWTYRTGGAIYSSPAVASNGNVYVGSADGTVYALANNGTELWRFCTKGPGVRPEGAVFASPTLGTDGSVYVAGLYDPNLYALNPGDGSVKWVCKFKQSSGQSQPTAWPFASPVVAANGTIYQVLLHDAHLYAIEPGGGTILWAADMVDPCSISRPAAGPRLNGDGWSEPALGPDGTIYVSTNDPYLRAVDPSGRIKWAVQLGETGAFTMTVDKRGYVYAASEDGYIYVVRPDGSQLARLGVGGSPTFPVLAADDVLVVPDSKDYSLLITDVKNTVWAISSKCTENQP